MKTVDAGSPPWYVAEGQRGEQLLEQGQVEQARAVFEGMLARLGPSRSYIRAVVLGRLARCCRIAGRVDLAERHARDALDVAESLAPTDGVKSLLGTLRSELGDAFRARGLYTEARDAYEAALKTAGDLNDVRAQAVELGRLGALAAAQGDVQEALTRFESARRLFQQAGDSQQLARCLNGMGGLLASDSARDVSGLARHAPVVFVTLARLGLAPSYARAILLGHLARWWCVRGQLDLALACAGEALGLAATLPPTDGVRSLRGALHLDLGDMLRTAGGDADARDAYEAALALAEELQDVRGQAAASERLGMIVYAAPRQDASPVEITAYDDVTIDYVFDPDLLIDGPRQRRIVGWTDAPLTDSVRPMLLPSARTWVDEGAAVWFSIPFGEPAVERDPDCTVLRRSRREVRVSGESDVLWRVLRAMDGTRVLGEILSGVPARERAVATRMVGALAATGIVDVTGRSLGRFIHLVTKKGVLPGGGLEGEAVLQLAADGNYRTYPGAPRVPVGSDVPDRLRALHTLTRARRSSRDYPGAPVTRADFEALLHTACGVTGTLAAAGREVQLRAYPSSGALYAVEIYPVVFRVDGLESAVYHYRASENVLEVVRSGIDPASVVRAALPVEREMVAGAAALLCLAGWFPRHERKYGEGGYRMLVAEAGHISQNLILAATALGLSARPFGGVFDDLLNQDLGLDGVEEQFLLAVLVGSSGP
jgi:SagB-type dehydrogenase family enzyme